MKKLSFLLLLFFLVSLVSQSQEVTKKWLFNYSNASDTWKAWFDIEAESTRGIAYYDGKLYLPSRKSIEGTPKVLVADAVTGAHLTEIDLPIVYEEGEAIGTFKINDIVVTEDGEFLIGNLATSANVEGSAHFVVYKFADETFKTCTKLIDYKVDDVYGANVRLGDGISAYGSMTESGDGYVVAAAGALDVVFKFNIQGGAHTSTDVIVAEEFYPKGTETAPITNFGTAPRCFAAEDYVIVDGKDLAPSIYNFEGIMLDSFKGEAGVATPTENNMNGVLEFSLAGKTYIVCANTTWLTDPKMSYALFEIPESGMTNAVKMAVFPEEGMGDAIRKASCMVMPIAINVVEDDAYADIYVMCPKNGIGSYRLTVPNGINDSKVSTVFISSDKGQIICDREVAFIELFNLSGQKVASVQNARSIAASSGLYIVKVIDQEGAMKVSKTIVL